MNIFIWGLYTILTILYIIGLLIVPINTFSSVLCVLLGMWVIWFLFGGRNPNVFKFVTNGVLFSDFVFFSYITIYLIIALSRFGIS